MEGGRENTDSREDRRVARQEGPVRCARIRRRARLWLTLFTEPLKHFSALLRLRSLLMLTTTAMTM
jgi:hypothetical protein